jgi:hypothetical protein
VGGSRGRRVDPLSVRRRAMLASDRWAGAGPRTRNPEPSSVAAALLAFFWVVDDTVGRSWRGPKASFGASPSRFSLPCSVRKVFVRIHEYIISCINHLFTLQH